MLDRVKAGELATAPNGACLLDSARVSWL